MHNTGGKVREMARKRRSMEEEEEERSEGGKRVVAGWANGVIYKQAIDTRHR